MYNIRFPDGAVIGTHTADFDAACVLWWQHYLRKPCTLTWN